jgi:hypothetical protein
MRRALAGLLLVACKPASPAPPRPAEVVLDPRAALADAAAEASRDAAGDAGAGPSDFAKVIECDEELHAVVVAGTEIWLLGFQEQPTGESVGIARWDTATGELADMQRLRLATPFPSVTDVAVRGSSRATSRIALDSSCAPNLEKAGNPLHCLSSELVYAKGRWTVGTEPRWVDQTGTLISPPAARNALTAAFRKAHPGCTFSGGEPVSFDVPGARVTYALGCSNDCSTVGCYVLFQPPGGPVAWEPAELGHAWRFRGGAFFLTTEGGKPAGHVLDGRGVRAVTLPEADAESDTAGATTDPYTGTLWLQIGHGLYQSEDGEHWRRECPFDSCAMPVFVLGQRFVWSHDDPRRLGRRDPSGQWTVLCTRFSDSAIFGDLLSTGVETWVGFTPSAWYRVGAASAGSTYRCSSNPASPMFEKVDGAGKE